MHKMYLQGGKQVNYKALIESRMDRLLNKKNELVDKYFADGRLGTHAEIRTLQLLDKKYLEYATILRDFFFPGQDEPEEKDWEWKAR